MAFSRDKGLQKQLDEIRREGEERLARQRAEKTGRSYVDLRTTPIAPHALTLIPEAEARSAQIAVMQVTHKKAAVAAFDPGTPATQEVLKKLAASGHEAEIFIASLSGLGTAWGGYRLLPRATSRAITGKLTIEASRAQELSGTLSSLQAVVKEVSAIDFSKLETAEFVESLLVGAIINRASDIHLESEEGVGKMRYRIDGALYDIFEGIPARNFHALISRVKLIAELKINVTDEPQDGRFTVEFGEKDVEARVSVIPAEFGETVVMRILDPDAIHIDLNGLGLRADDEALVARELEKPNGMLLNTGPTGSGKTTTLYAFLRYANKSDVKIITVEDPIEYHLEGVEQTQVDEKTGYTFARGLRSILRQDPNIILVGEIRDRETADTAMQAALTGHLVFSTLHANDAVGATPRLVNLGVSPAVIGPATNTILAQRLVRLLCSSCKKPRAISPEMRNTIAAFVKKLPARVKRDEYEAPTLYDAAGCEKCSGIGYKGRVGVFELLGAGKDFEEKVLHDASEVALRELAEAQGMVTMQEDGVLKALKGVTTLEEVERATGPVAW